jgi:hypothetical protein
MEGTDQSSIFARSPIATGIAIGFAALIPHSFLSPAMSLAFAAILLGVVAGAYFGFAVTSGNNIQQQIEFTVSFLFAIAALLGLGVSPWFIPAAFLGAWSMGFRPSQPRQFAPCLHSAMVHSVVRHHRLHCRDRAACSRAEPIPRGRECPCASVS